MVDRVVIVGAGQAGFACAAKLRQQGFSGAITLFGDEGVVPYQRPPLSKAYLLGKLEPERMAFRASDFFVSVAIDLRVNEPVLAIDRELRLVVTKAGRLPYDHLVLATGASPIELPARIRGDVAKVFHLRTMADADRLRPMLHDGARILVVGGGYVGLEVAAAGRQAGATVTLIEMADRILGRVAAEPTARHLRELHASQGVTIREAVGLDTLIVDGPAIMAALTDGTRLSVDAVVVGIGVRPNSGLAERAGLTIGNGVMVDASGRTSDPHIWAAGDCACFLHDGDWIRLESVPHAIAQAEQVACNILGENCPYRPRPWFWSDQYATKLQIAGLNRGFDHTEAATGPAEDSLRVSYFRAGNLIAVDCINDARGFMTAKRELGLV